MKNTAGEAKRRGRKAHQERPTAIQTKKGDQSLPKIN